MSGGEGWVPEFPGQRPPFTADHPAIAQPGNERALRHGAFSPRRVVPLAQEYVDLLLGDETGSVPAYAKAAAYRAELWATARAEAQVQLLSEFLMAQAEKAGNGVGNLDAARVRTAYRELHRAEQRAASGRSRLGLTPVAAARMGKDVAIGHAAEIDVARRMAQLHDYEEQLKAQGWTPPAGSDGTEGKESE